jgi:hypothetical protein
MSNKLFTVTLTDLGTYTVTVAAETPAEAQSIAKGILFEEATTLAPGMSIIKREADAIAEPAKDLPIRQFRVTGTHSIVFSMTVPAANRQEAECHARRLYDENCGPFEFEHDDQRTGPFTAREVAS